MRARAGARTRCGTTRPTKPTRPAAATVAAASSDAARKTRGPRDRRHAEPRGGVVAEGEHVDRAREREQRAEPSATYVRGEPRPASSVASPTDPIIHQSASRTTLACAFASATMIAAFANAPTTTPAMSSDARVATPAGGARDDQRERDRRRARRRRPRRDEPEGRHAQRDGEDRTHRRATRDAEQVRLGERVPRRALQRRARDIRAPRRRAPRARRAAAQRCARRRRSVALALPASAPTRRRARCAPCPSITPASAQRRSSGGDEHGPPRRGHVTSTAPGCSRPRERPRRLAEPRTADGPTSIVSTTSNRPSRTARSARHAESATYLRAAIRGERARRPGRAAAHPRP